MPAVRRHGNLLQEAFVDLATHVAETFLDMRPGQTEAMLQAYAADHAHPITPTVREQEAESTLQAER